MTIPNIFRRLLPRGSAEPYCNERTFLLWEPCSSSHAEIVPGFAKHLLDAGYEVSVLLTPARLDEGLFSRFSDPRLHLNRLTQREIRAHFRRHGLGDAAGVMVTTSGKLAPPGDYPTEVAYFGARRPSQQVILVEHDVGAGVDRGTLTPRIVTLREVHHRGAATTPVNPHHFGEVPPHAKNAITRFATVGAMRSKRRNSTLLIEAVSALTSEGVEAFAIDVVGKGDLRGIPRRLRPWIELHGRLDFDRMYDVVAAADFLLPLLDPASPAHRRYITTGTSGTFQLAFGFRTPCVVERSFASVNLLGEANSIVYEGNSALAAAMRSGIEMSPDQYARLRDRLAADAAELAAISLWNLRTLLP